MYCDKIRTEWNVNPPTSRSINRLERILKETETLVSQTGKYPYVLVIEDTVDRVRDSFCRSPEKSIRQASNDIRFCSKKPLYTRGI
ncbi:UNVERIFIED_CONTAM: hypothetical protein NCL1_48116 [Trichonephila clavipes]